MSAENQKLRAQLKSLREAAGDMITDLDARAEDGPSTGPASTVPFAEYAKLCVDFHELKAELETSRECARKWKNELELVRGEWSDLQCDLEACVKREFRAVRERDEARTNNVKHIERGKWLTAETHKWQDSCHAARRERDEWNQAYNEAMNQVLTLEQAPRAQVFDPALVRELLELCDQESACCTAEFLGKPTPWHGWPDLLTCCTALRDSENRAAEPYGIAKTDRLLAVISARFGVGDQIRDLAEAVRNSRGGK